MVVQELRLEDFIDKIIEKLEKDEELEKHQQHIINKLFIGKHFILKRKRTEFKNYDKKIRLFKAGTQVKVTNIYHSILSLSNQLSIETIIENDEYSASLLTFLDSIK